MATACSKPPEGRKRWTLNLLADNLVRLREFRRNGTANMFVFFDRHRGWRKVKISDQRAAGDAQCACAIWSISTFPGAERIRVVLDNLSTHSAGSIYETFSAPQATGSSTRSIHFTPTR